MSAVGRLDEGSARWYVDPVDDTLRYESVTTILSAASGKPWLTAWAAKVAAEWTADHLPTINAVSIDVGREGVVDLIKGAAKRARETKADIGTHQHDVLEALLLDRPIPDVPEHLVGVEVDGETVDHDAISDGLLNFLDDFAVTPELAEATVASVLHGYAGTLDLVALFPTLRLPGLPQRTLRGLVDCKTGTYLDASMRAQLAAYRRADEVWLDQLGNRIPMPQVDFAAVLHLRRSYERGYKLLLVDTSDESFEWFLACQRVLRHQDEQVKVSGGALYPPLPDGTQPPPLLEDTDHPGVNRCRRKLIAAGYRSLLDLTAATAADLKALDGVGPKAIAAVAELLAAHDLTLRENA